MILYLAAIAEHPQGWSDKMNLYLAGEHSVKNGELALSFKPYETLPSADIYSLERSHTHTHTHTQELGWWKGSHILESFYYVRRNKYFPILYEQGADLMLDSGAFSVLDNGMRVESWDAYIEEYAQFVNRYNIQKFIELDIESVVGMKEMERLRDKLERLTNKQCIPVWHRWRGLEYYKMMCERWNYVCFGGLMSDGVGLKKLEQVFPWFINEAHKRGTKIHCLGYSPTDLAKKPFRFDSVDSSSWVAGNRFGHIYKFNESTGVMEKFDKKAGQRVKHIEAAAHNLNEWIKYQKYLEKL